MSGYEWLVGTRVGRPQGMPGCGNFGIPVLDTTEGRTRVHYFDTTTREKSAAAGRAWAPQHRPERG